MKFFDLVPLLIIAAIADILQYLGGLFLAIPVLGVPVFGAFWLLSFMLGVFLALWIWVQGKISFKSLWQAPVLILGPSRIAVVLWMYFKNVAAKTVVKVAKVVPQTKAVAQVADKTLKAAGKA